MQETRVWPLGRKDLPRRKLATTHSSSLGWRIPWTEEPSGLQSMESQGVRHDWACMLTWHWLRTGSRLLILTFYQSLSSINTCKKNSNIQVICLPYLVKTSWGNELAWKCQWCSISLSPLLHSDEDGVVPRHRALPTWAHGLPVLFNRGRELSKALVLNCLIPSALVHQV